MLNVHRHHTIGHVLDEMNVQGASRALVYEDNDTPVGIITRSGLTFSEMMGPKDEMETKNIKMTRKESNAGRKQYRYVKQMPLVAEDIMTSPIITMNSEMNAVEAAKMLAEKHIIRHARPGDEPGRGLLLRGRDHRRDKEVEVMQVKDIMTEPITIDKSERIGHALRSDGEARPEAGYWSPTRTSWEA